MTRSDDENLDLSSNQHEVDSLNSEFYGRFPYPWPPQAFPLIADGDLERIMLNQSVGSWAHNRIARDASIWVAGCGTNQAIYTALKFPHATIVASDISTNSLDISNKTANALGLKNIVFRQESLNQVDYDAEFDYVICTGVIHHNAAPAIPLTRISRAMKPAGILELMVYNRYHRLLTTGVQKAVRILSRAAGRESDFNVEFRIAKAIIDGGPLPAAVKDYYRNSSNAEFADAWLQPVERSYTIDSLNDLAASCRLQLLIPCLTDYDHANSIMSWDVSFEDGAVQDQYDRLGDVERWQAGNLLLGGRSPMLWFYLCREEMNNPANFEQHLCKEFLDLRFERVQTSMRSYVRDSVGAYRLNQVDAPYPQMSGNAAVRKILERTTPAKSMRQILTELGIDAANRKLVNEIRIQTTGPICPYLKALI